MYVRAVPLTSRGQRCSAVPLCMSASVNRSLEAWWGGSIARMLEDAGGLEGSIMLDIARSTAEDSARVQGELLTRVHTDTGQQWVQ